MSWLNWNYAMMFLGVVMVCAPFILPWTRRRH